MYEIRFHFLSNPEQHFWVATILPRVNRNLISERFFWSRFLHDNHLDKRQVTALRFRHFNWHLIRFPLNWDFYGSGKGSMSSFWSFLPCEVETSGGYPGFPGFEAAKSEGCQMDEGLGDVGYFSCQSATPEPSWVRILGRSTFPVSLE